MPQVDNNLVEEVRPARKLEEGEVARFRTEMVFAAAAGNITRADRNTTRYYVNDGIMAVDLIASAVGGFILGGLTVGLLVLWWVR